ncbi:MAG: FAD-dependent monooxygenase [Bacteroidia bacterium]|nr:FAD-dependent monooxygenase [Bacteroidia bacterium]
MQKFDCIIIGGGLGGLTLAIQLAKKGYKIALIEKETYPFHKVCGEYIAMESWNYLINCGIDLPNLHLPRLEKLKVSAPNGNFIEHELNPGGFGISRYKLDYLLSIEAKKLGVYLLENCKVNDVTEINENNYLVYSNADTIEAKIIIGSYGKRSNLDVKLNRDFIKNKAKGLDNYIGIKYHVKANLPNDVIELHNFKNGYCGISKIEEEKYCLCYLTTAQNLKNHQGNIKKMEENILFKNPFLEKYFTSFESIYEEPLAISQISFSNKTQHEKGIIMLGDAAGLITPLCGNGMSMAMKAAKILSDLLPQYFENEITKTHLIAKYAFQWNQNFSTRLWAGRKIQAVFGNEIMTNLLINVIKPMPFLVNKLVSLTHGKPF